MATTDRPVTRFELEYGDPDYVPRDAPTSVDEQGRAERHTRPPRQLTDEQRAEFDQLYRNTAAILSETNDATVAADGTAIEQRFVPRHLQPTPDARRKYTVEWGQPDLLEAHQGLRAGDGYLDDMIDALPEALRGCRGVPIEPTLRRLPEALAQWLSRRVDFFARWMQGITAQTGLPMQLREELTLAAFVESYIDRAGAYLYELEAIDPALDRRYSIAGHEARRQMTKRHLILRAKFNTHDYTRQNIIDEETLKSKDHSLGDDSIDVWCMDNVSTEIHLAAPRASDAAFAVCNLRSLKEKHAQVRRIPVRVWGVSVRVRALS